MAKTHIDRNNPAFDFIKTAGREEPQQEEQQPIRKAPAKLKQSVQEQPADGYKLNPLYVEKKTKRVQLVLQPSLYDKVKAAADADGVSFNEYCHRLLEEATKGD